LCVFAAASTAAAQPKVTLAAPKPGKIDALVPVMAQSARVAAVSDVHGLLAFGHDKDYADAHVSLFKLDAKGTPAAAGTQLKLPKPAGLVKNKNYVTGVAFHPKLPVLYVWQDIDVYYSNPPPPAPPETKQFDHLCIFNLAKDPPELLVSMCRGDDYIYGQGAGAVAVDPTGSWLYVPNLRELKNAGSLRFGRYPLDADGLPSLSESKDPIAARIKKLTELSAANACAPPQMTPLEYVHLFNYSSWGCGACFVPIGKDVVIATAHAGLIAWRPEEKHTTIHGLPLRKTGNVQIAVHPTLPAIFATAHHGPSDSFFRAEQTEGYLTLLPKQYVIEKTSLTGQPAILPKLKKVAIGAQNAVYLVDLDDKGFPTGSVMQTMVNCPQVRAMVYSEKYERAYVGVEVSK
jgi:hypothetical protein